jgi:GNAT superfamily N-acetyltransferase
MTNITFAPAGTLALDTLAELFTRSFEGYLLPVTLLPEQLAQRVRTEQIDLWHSLVLLVDAVPAGVALVALRGTRAWCGGFGICAPWRGQGLAFPLAQKMLEEAQAAGATQFTLEVLAKNSRARQVYERARLRTTRDLLILEWRRGNGQVIEAGAGLNIITPDEALRYFAPFHQQPAAWQRDLAALLCRGGMQSLALHEGSSLQAYALYQEMPGAGARLIDIGAQDAGTALALVQGLKQRYERLISVNEPEHSLIATALLNAGFAELDRQHEMAIAL